MSINMIAKQNNEFSWNTMMEGCWMRHPLDKATIFAFAKVCCLLCAALLHSVPFELLDCHEGNTKSNKWIIMQLVKWVCHWLICILQTLARWQCTYLVFTCLWLSSSEALVGNAKLDPCQFKVGHTFGTMAKMLRHTFTFLVVEIEFIEFLLTVKQ